jgi:hypothetical protein
MQHTYAPLLALIFVGNQRLKSFANGTDFADLFLPMTANIQHNAEKKYRDLERARSRYTIYLLVGRSASDAENTAKCDKNRMAETTAWVQKSCLGYLAYRAESAMFRASVALGPSYCDALEENHKGRCTVADVGRFRKRGPKPLAETVLDC